MPVGAAQGALSDQIAVGIDNQWRPGEVRVALAAELVDRIVSPAVSTTWYQLKRNSACRRCARIIAILVYTALDCCSIQVTRSIDRQAARREDSIGAAAKVVQDGFGPGAANHRPQFKRRSTVKLAAMFGCAVQVAGVVKNDCAARINSVRRRRAKIIDNSLSPSAPVCRAELNDCPAAEAARTRCHV